MHYFSKQLLTFLVPAALFLGLAPAALAAPVILPANIPDVRVGTPYSQTATLDGYVTPAATWSLTGGALPAGVSFSPLADHTGATISGTPTAEGSFTFTFKVDNGAGYDRIKTYTFNVLPMIVTARALPNAQVGTVYSQTLTTDGGVAPISWVISGGQLPVGLTLSSSGVISGTPMYALSHVFTAKATDAAGRTADHSFDLRVTASSLDITTSSFGGGTVGLPYSLDLAGTGGSPAYTWTVDGGSWLPPGLTLSTTGLVRGTPTTPGNYSFTVMLRDAVNTVKTKSFTMSILPSGSASLSITTNTLPGGTVGTWYGQTLNATGGIAPYTWNFASGTLPPGVTLSTNGSLYGTPTTPGTYRFHLEVFDNTRAFAGRDYTVTIGGTVGGGSTGGSTEVTTRLNNFSRIGVSVHALVKLPDDGNRFTQADSAVYYLGADGRRHAFPNDKVFFSWYTGFSGVRVLNATDLASIPLGANVTYKPGVKMVKFQTDAHVYVVAANRVLRLVASEGAAQELYGASWNRQIDDIADTFFLDYTVSTSDPVTGLYNFNPTAVRGAANYVSDTLPLL